MTHLLYFEPEYNPSKRKEKSNSKAERSFPSRVPQIGSCRKTAPWYLRNALFLSYKGMINVSMQSKCVVREV